MGNHPKMADKQRILALLELGWSHRRIQRETGVHRETVAGSTPDADPKTGQPVHRLDFKTGHPVRRPRQRLRAVPWLHRGEACRGADGTADLAGPHYGTRLLPPIRQCQALRPRTQEAAPRGGRRHGASAGQGSPGGLLPGPADPPSPGRTLAPPLDTPGYPVLLATWLRGSHVDPGEGRLPAGHRACLPGLRGRAARSCATTT